MTREQVELGVMWVRKGGVLSGPASMTLRMMLHQRIGDDWELVAFPIDSTKGKSPTHRLVLQRKEPQE